MAFLRCTKTDVGQVIRDVAAYILRASPDQAVIVLNQAVPEWCERLAGICDETVTLLEDLRTLAGDWLADELDQPFASAQLAEKLMCAKHALFGTAAEWKKQIKRRKKLLKSGTEIFHKPGKSDREAASSYWLELPASPPLIRGVPITKLVPAFLSIATSGTAAASQVVAAAPSPAAPAPRNSGFSPRGPRPFQPRQPRWHAPRHDVGPPPFMGVLPGYPPYGSVVTGPFPPPPPTLHLAQPLPPQNASFVSGTPQITSDGGLVFGFFKKECGKKGLDIRNACPACVLRQVPNTAHNFRDCPQGPLANRDYALKMGYVPPAAAP